MKIHVDYEKGGFKPQRAHFDDAGLDLRTPESFVLEHGESKIVNTYVAMQIPVGYCGITKSKSGLNVKLNIQNEDGVIDSSYRGYIRVRVTNNGYMYRFERGDKLCQIIIVPCLLCDLEEVEQLDESISGRDENGFGSTGK